MCYRTTSIFVHIVTGFLVLSCFGDRDTDSETSYVGFQRPPVVTIFGKKARIHFVVIEPVSGVNVTNCVRGTKKCVTKYVAVPTDRGNRGIPKIYDFRSEVDLADENAKSLTFSFWNYVGDTLLDPLPYQSEVKSVSYGYRLITTLLVTTFTCMIILTICIILLKELCRGRKAGQKYKFARRFKNSKAIKSAQSSDWCKLKEYSSQTEINLRPNWFRQSISSSVVHDSLLNDGKFYQVWKGKLVDVKDVHQDVIIKVDKGHSEGYKYYLIKEGEALAKLRSNDYVIGCLGLTPDNKCLIMEVAAMGNLKQHLKAKAEEYPPSLTSTPSYAIKFINQIYEGVSAVHHLKPPCLFYCLCAANVLVSGDGKCKLSGFARCDVVRQREQYEEKYNLPRPIRWLSPEAITLDHIQKSDIWSFGVLMWEVFSDGKDPFGEYSSDEVRQIILTGQKLLKPPKCSNQMYDIMLRCWMHEPHNRPSLNDISQSLLDLPCKTYD